MRNIENNNKGEIVNIVSKNKKAINLQGSTSLLGSKNKPAENVQTGVEDSVSDEPGERKINKKLYLPIIAFILLILIGFFAFFYFSR